MDGHPDQQRIARNRQALRAGGIDALVCALPANVLLLSGYDPVVGNTIAIATADSTTLIVPGDEQDLARGGWAENVLSFQPGSLSKLQSLTEAVKPPLASALRSLNLNHAAIAHEQGPWFQPASYASMCGYGAALLSLLKECVPQARLSDGDKLLRQLRLVKTPAEIAHIRHACHIAAAAFIDSSAHIRPGRTETDVASHVQSGLLQSTDEQRVAGYAFCMSGPNAANAYKAFQRSSQRQLRAGDSALVHCNSSAGGYWTDITRTYCIGEPTDRQRAMYQAVLDVRQAALEAIRPGVRAADVDCAARTVLESHGFAKQFKHPTGHGVGFAAINHDARPRLHPLSDETLEVGMVFNVEPAVYFDGECGLRHCDMVAVGQSGADLLTPFQDRLDRLILNAD